MQEGSKFFTVMAIGDNPEELMNKYQIGLEVEPYVKYKYLDAHKMRLNAVKVLKEIVEKPKNFSLSQFHVDYFNERINNLNNMSDFDYYVELTQGLKYDKDGNALSTENPNGKWTTYTIGNFLSIPLILKDGTQTRQALNKDIDWSKLHMVDVDLYDLTWQIVKEDKIVSNEMEKTILKNMGDKKNYFASFKCKEDYISHNCSYWNYAYLDENGWKDIDDDKSSVKWIANYFDTFVKPLKPNDKVTIFECTKMKGDKIEN